MPAVYATAPGKAILFGEHAVVYGQPAIAVPITTIMAKAVILAEPLKPHGYIRIEAPQIDLDCEIDQLPKDHPLNLAVTLVMQQVQIRELPALRLRITSTIPVAAGLGSGAAVSIAIIRSLTSFLGFPIQPEDISKIAFEVEKKYHGNPSGIDNTVITYAQPIYFVRGQPFEFIKVIRPFELIIADSGVKSSTATVVSDVRQLWQANPAEYERLFNSIGEITNQARLMVEGGSLETLGNLMNENHEYLKTMGVSSPLLDQLIQSALAAGALGAKLSGAGRGGNIIALVKLEDIGRVSSALLEAGAENTFNTTVHST